MPADLPALRAHANAAKAALLGPHDEMNTIAIGVLIEELLALAESQAAELNDFRETNRRLNRRVQAFESVAAQDRLSSYWIEYGKARGRERVAEQAAQEELVGARRLGLARKANRELTAERDEARVKLAATRLRLAAMSAQLLAADVLVSDLLDVCAQDAIRFDDDLDYRLNNWIETSRLVILDAMGVVEEATGEDTP